MSQACVDDPPTIVVDYAISLSDDCVATVNSETKIAVGNYDARCGKGYYVFLRVLSYLLARSDVTRPRTEVNVIQMDTAEINLLDSSGAAIDGLPAFSIPIEGTIHPGDEKEPGAGVVQVEIIPSTYGEMMRGLDGEKLVAAIKLYGTTAGDVDVESKTFNFPFNVCDGCLTWITHNALGEDVCRFSDLEEQAVYDELEGCQRNQGYDGSVCCIYSPE